MQSKQNAKGLGEWRDIWDLSCSHIRVEGAPGPQLQPHHTEKQSDRALGDGYLGEVFVVGV